MLAVFFAAALHVRAIQHAGWWEGRYPDGTVAANELHIPAGQNVTIDVALDGAGILISRFPRFGPVEMRLANGETSIVTALRLREPRTSDLTIIGDDHFEDWIAGQRRGAPHPENTIVARGQAVFLTARCTLCHTVRGLVTAEQPVAPDLTHFATRRTLAGTFPNRPGFLSGWIVDAEAMKPGAGMPINNINAEDLQSLLEFLRALR